jgi:pyruvate dehydrogenase E2 component (dihydrolipoamide acetyltransferase)
MHGQREAASEPSSAGGFHGVAAWPQIDFFSSFGQVERQALLRIQKRSGANLHRNRVMIPHVNHHDGADITDLEAFCVQLNQRADTAADFTPQPELGSPGDRRCCGGPL